MKRKSASKMSRRSFVGSALYVPPAILTLNAMPAFASYGSDVPPAAPPGHLVDRLKALLRAWLG